MSNIIRWKIEDGKLVAETDAGHVLHYGIGTDPESWSVYTNPLALIHGGYTFKAVSGTQSDSVRVAGDVGQSATSGGAILIVLDILLQRLCSP